MIIQKKAYAKINLYLKILDKRPDGYHNIFTVMQKISLFDEITININPREGQNINIICNDKNIPTDKTNTVYKAAELFLERADIFADIEITINKKIPSQAGLGGGSSDAGSVLLGLNEYFDFILPENVLIEIAAKVGADVPFFVKNVNCAFCEGIGEIVSPIYIDLSGFYCLIVKPAYNVSTRQAYDDWDNSMRGRTGASAPTIDIDDVMQNIHNDFYNLACSQNPNIKQIKDLLIQSGAIAAELSGSGSALFGIFDSLDNVQKCREQILHSTRRAENVQNDNLKWDIEFCDIFEFLC
jgi:4-diphosphocytidyl-2-C-methyl-D-erythritol kinase